jgi:hypothetical protein
MKKTGVILCGTLLYALLLPAQGPISGFLPRAGQLQFAANYSIESYDTYLRADDAIDQALDSRSYSLFAEYGLAEHNSLVVTLPYVDNGSDNRAWQDAALWFKYRNLRREVDHGQHTLLTAVGLTFPVGNYAADTPLAIGRRATVFGGRLVWQYQDYNGWFLQVQSGIDFQVAPDAAAAWPLLLRAGWGTPWFYVEGWLENYAALETTGNSGNLAAGVQSSWLRTGGTLYFPVRPWLGVQGGWAYMLDGAFIGQSTRWFTGFVLQFGGVEPE